MNERREARERFGWANRSLGLREEPGVGRRIVG
jgi:hypothetical protein